MTPGAVIEHPEPGFTLPKTVFVASGTGGGVGSASAASGIRSNAAAPISPARIARSARISRPLDNLGEQIILADDLAQPHLEAHDAGAGCVDLGEHLERLDFHYRVAVIDCGTVLNEEARDRPGKR